MICKEACFRLIYPICVLNFILLFTFPLCSADCGLLKPIKPNDTIRAKELELLQKIKPLTGKTFQVKDSVDPSKYTYKIGICGKVDDKPNVGAIQIEGDKTFILGRFNETDVMGGTDWLQLTYYGGDQYNHTCNKTRRIVKIMIICDPDSEVGDFGNLEERKHIDEDCFYLFEMGSSLACKVTEKKRGLSSGSVFCILFFTAILCYLVLGVLYKRIVLGAKGLDQIPNYSFWRDFGNLQADGCDFICRFGSRHESNAYRGIDDHLKEEERDDQLLNM